MLTVAILMIATAAPATAPASRPATTRAATTATAPASRPVAVFRSIGDILMTVPRDVVADTPAGWTGASVEEANRHLNDRVVGERAAIRFRIDRVERTAEGRYQGQWRIVSDIPPTRSVEPVVFVYCTDEQQPDLARLRRGQPVAIRGVITHCGLERRDGKTFLVINIFDPAINK